MNAAVAVFDTLAYAKKLKAAGVPEKQAEAHAEAMIDVIDNGLATKHDIHDVKSDIKRLDSDMKKMGQDLRTEMKQTSYMLTIRLGGMIFTGITALGILIKFF